MTTRTNNSLKLQVNSCAQRGFVAFLVKIARKILGISSETTTNRPNTKPSTISNEDVPCGTESNGEVLQTETKRHPAMRRKTSATAFPDNGKREAAIRILGKSAKKDPSRFFAIAELYSTENAEDRKMAAKYEALGRKREKSLHQSHIRDLRRYAEMRRGGHSCKTHLSASRYVAMRLADVDLFRNDVQKYKRRKSRAA